MPRCLFCGHGFPSDAALAGHVKKRHLTESQRSGNVGASPLTDEEIVAAALPKSSHQAACPICSLKLPYTTITDDNDRTVCPRCLAQYEQRTDVLVSPPPEECVAEKLGRPCSAPEHKKYYAEYVAREGVQ
jgi:hypothetical protein